MIDQPPINKFDINEELTKGNYVVHTNSTENTVTYELEFLGLKIEAELAPNHCIRFSKQ